jgi:hypothetical protein
VHNGLCIVDASGSGGEGVRRLHLHPDRDFERRCAVDCRLREPQPGRQLLLLHGGKTPIVLHCSSEAYTALPAQGGIMCPDATPVTGVIGSATRSCDLCGCTVDSWSGSAKVPFNGCANHADRGLNGNPWCYVAGGTACKAAHVDPSVPGSAWKPCSDPNCQCVPPTAASTRQYSGVVDIKATERGCGDHDSRGYEWCWVTKGTGCPSATPATDPSMKTAAWQKCSASACDCLLDRSVPDLPNKAIPLGCARHFSEDDDGDRTSSGVKMKAEVCYVKGGASCSRNTSSDVFIPDAAWRDCSMDCYGIGSSFSPEMRAACSCFNTTKPSTPHVARVAYHLIRPPSAFEFELSASQTDSKSATRSPFTTRTLSQRSY